MKLINSFSNVLVTLVILSSCNSEQSASQKFSKAPDKKTDDPKDVAGSMADANPNLGGLGGDDGTGSGGDSDGGENIDRIKETLLDSEGENAIVTEGNILETIPGSSAIADLIGSIAENVSGESSSELPADSESSDEVSIQSATPEATQVVAEVCSSAIPIYRWYNPKTEDHFYTPFANKACGGKSKADSNCKGETVNEGGYVFEKVEFYVQALSSSMTQRIFRFHDGLSGNHIYTKHIREREFLANETGGRFTHENGGDFFTFTESFGVAVPIHRWLRNTAAGHHDHFFTTSGYNGCQKEPNPTQACGEAIRKTDIYEGIIGYGFKTKPSCGL